MRAIVKILLLSVLISACNTKGIEDYQADKYLNEAAQQTFLYDIMRYMGRLAPQATQATKHEARFDEHYTKQVNAHRLDFYYADAKSGFIYFAVSRIAPSIHVKRVTIGGKLKRNEEGEIAYYEEVFRTWKMLEAEHAEKSAMLFAKMVKGEDLSPYYPENSGKEEFIEFPNEDVYFDAEQRLWISRREDPLQPYYHLKMQEN
ncbi:MAG TPA: hypothetical protein PKC76_17665 [Saprospiraceae bacterium]|nr:hypothetical protein [Saprospiraceae bacterium]HMP25963.1 hypothetical protein [Saprospiraceae bacterium]